MAFLDVEQAEAQRPYMTHDPFYWGESAQRAFYDTYAITGEVAYRPADGITRDDEAGAPSVDPLGLSLRFDYQLARQLDLGAILNASGGRTGRSLSVSWVVLKYYEFVDDADYAFRLAVDPVSDGLMGFPQMDAALIASLPMTHNIMGDLAVGARRVRMGYDRWVRQQQEQDDLSTGEAMMLEAETAPPPFDVVRTRVMGWELHAMLSYNYQFDLAGSNIFMTAAAEAGEYDLFEAAHEELAGEDRVESPESSFTETYQASVIWLRTGVEYNRPSFQVNPFVGMPLVQWNSTDDDSVRARLSAGLSLMLR